MIFCDVSTPKNDSSFSVYDDIKKKLMNLGVGKDEVAFIHDAKTDEQKEKLFSKVRCGEVRVLLGSTPKMGAGTNVQNKLFALHHLDCPWKPSDLEQRAGRIVRQGNSNKEVEIYQYVTKQTFDSYLWQIVESKQKFISQIMTGKSPSRSMEDIDQTVLNFAEVKAIATGNPLIKKKMELEMEVSRLQVLEKQYLASKYSLEDATIKHLPTKISNYETKIKNIELDVQSLKTVKVEDFSIRLGNKTFTERTDAGELLLKAINSRKYVDKEIGEYMGFKIIPNERFSLLDAPSITLKGHSTYKIELSNSDHGSIMRIENTINNLHQKLEELKEMQLETRQQLESAKEQLQMPFEHEKTLKFIVQELTEVNGELEIDKDGVSDVLLDTENESAENIEVTEIFKEEFEEDLEM